MVEKLEQYKRQDGTYHIRRLIADENPDADSMNLTFAAFFGDDGEDEESELVKLARKLNERHGQQQEREDDDRAKEIIAKSDRGERLTNEELLVWVDRQIGDDMAPDLWATMEAQRRGHIDARAKACDLAKEKAIREAELIEDNRALARKLEVVGESAGEAKEYAKRLEDENREWSNTYDAANDIIKAVAEEAQEAWFQRRKVDPELIRTLTARWFGGGSESC